MNSTSATKTILLLDDSADDLALIRYLINKATLPFIPKVIEALSYNHGLELFKEHNPHCCVIDYYMGDNTGLDFLQAIKKHNTEYDTPIVVLTSTGDEKVALEMMQNGAHDCLQKTGVTEDLLGRSINYAVNNCRLRNDLYTLTHYDDLTGLLNRKSFFDSLTIAADNSDANKESFSLLFLDINNFKHINDQYDLQTGDRVLEEFATRIKNACSPVDSIARLCGDEFVILLKNSSEEACTLLADKILATLSKSFTHHANDINISVSIGIADYPDGNKNVSDLLRKKNITLYK